jgi:hypothetical protein
VATFYHELNEASTDADVEDAIRAGNNPNANSFLGWVSDQGEECGDYPVSEAGGNLTEVFQEVELTDNSGTVPVQFMYSDSAHGPEGPIAQANRPVNSLRRSVGSFSLLGLPSDRSENAFRRFFNLVERPNPSPEARDDLARLFQAAEQMAQSVQSQQRPSRTPGLSCDSLGGVTLFEFVDLHLRFLLGIFHGLADIVAHVVSFLLSGLLMRFTYLVCRILRVTPSFLCGTLCLIDNSLIGHFLIANGCADALLNLANDLIDLARNLVFIHFDPLLRYCAMYG